MDIEHLQETYIVISAQGAKALEGYDELRLLDNELEAGVQALYDDGGETIVAFVFSRAGFTEETAQAWVKEKEGEGINLSVEPGQPGQAISTAVDELTFEDVRGLLSEALESSQVTGADGQYRWPWLIDVYRDYCVIGLGARYYRVPYMIDAANLVTFGALQEVSKTYVPVEPEQVAAQAAERGGQPRVLSFHLREPDRLPAEASENDGLIWKEIFQVSTTFRPQTGRPLVVTDGMITSIEKSFQGRALNQVPIAASTHYHEEGGIVPASDTVGFVEKVVKAGKGLFAGLAILDDTIREKVSTSLIRDCSVYVWSDYHDQREPGKVWDWVLMHLLLTNYPQLPDLGGFGVGPQAVAASFSGVDFTTYTEDRMSEPTDRSEMSAEDRQRLADLEAFEAAGYTLAGAIEQARAVEASLRSLEVEEIVAALDGRASREDVIAIEGTRHYPAVIEAVRVALSAGPETISADMSGAAPGTSRAVLGMSDVGAMALDALVLGIVNSLPAEARIATGQAPALPNRGGDDGQEPAERTHRTEQISTDLVDAITDEQLDEFLARIGHRIETRDAGE